LMPSRPFSYAVSTRKPGGTLSRRGFNLGVF
jgi:hypothetical protein